MSGNLTGRESHVMTAVMDRTGMRCGKAGPALSANFPWSADILPQADGLQPAGPAYVLLDKQGAFCLSRVTQQTALEWADTRRLQRAT